MMIEDFSHKDEDGDEMTARQVFGMGSFMLLLSVQTNEVEGGWAGILLTPDKALELSAWLANAAHEPENQGE